MTYSRGRFVCIGCGRRPAPRRHSYCDTCHNRLEQGWLCVDSDDIVTKREAERARVPVVTVK